MATTDHNDEKDLLLRLQGGDHRAFETLYHRYSRQLIAKLDRKLAHASESEDILQELFIKVWERREQLDPDGPFAGYLYRIGERMVTDHFRRVARTSALHGEVRRDSTEITTPTDDRVATGETQRLIQQAVDRLPPQQRRTFSLCKLEGKTHKEAAAIMQVSPETVHAHLTKAVKAVKAHFQDGTDVLPGMLALAIVLF